MALISFPREFKKNGLSQRFGLKGVLKEESL